MKLEEIRSLLENVTPGPWRADPCWSAVYLPPNECVHWELGRVAPFIGEPPIRYLATYDKQFIAISRSIVPLLLDVAEAAKNLRDYYGGEARQRDLDALDVALFQLEVAK